MNNKKDYFAHTAKNYEKRTQIDNVKNIADTILKNISYDKGMELMDFGSGTGLLTSHIAPLVAKITTVDMSKSMNDILKHKSEQFPCEIEMLEIDLSKDTIDKKFDGIVSSMTMHHVENILELFENFHTMLNEGGTIALADLDSEDGSFHTEDTGVFHLGFDRDELLQTAKLAGFKNLKIELASIASKPYGDYPIFLLTGKK